MQVAAHLAISWFTAEAAGLDRARDRRIVALAGLAPDLDAVGYPLAWLWFGLDLDRAYAQYWQPFHHRFTHGIGFALATAAVAAWLARRRDAGDAGATRVALLAGAVSLAHVLCDVAGAGPGWPVYPLWPFSDRPYAAPWSWNVSDWPNGAATFALLAATMLHARAAGRSPVEALSGRLDRAVVAIVRGEAHLPRAAALRVRLLVYGLLALLVALVTLPLLGTLG